MTTNRRLTTIKLHKWDHPDIRSERKGAGSFVRYYIPMEGE